MPECERYEEMTSAYLDGELSAEDTQELMAHIQVCPSCASLMKTYGTLFAPTKLVAPPAGFAASVMGMTSAVRAPQRAKKRAPIIRILAAAAACLVLVVAFYPLASSLGGRKENAAADTAQVATVAAGGTSVPESVSVFTVATASEESEAAAETGSYGKDSSDGDTALFITAGIDAPAATESDESISEECDNAEAEAPTAESEVVTDSSTQAVEDTRLSTCSTLIAVYIHGQLPEICDGLEFQDLGDGSYAAEIDADLAAKLMAMDYEHDEGDVRYLVWYPD